MAEVRRAARRTRLDPARRAAYAALLRVATEDAYLNLTLPSLLTERGLTGRDAAFATEIAYGTARWSGTYDVFLDSLVRGGVASLEPSVLVALRIGAHQVLRMQVPARAGVGTSVELVRETAGERPVRMVNAVLRRLADTSFDEWVTRCAPAAENDPVGHRAVRYAHPSWIVEAFSRVLPPTEIDAALAADNEPPVVTLAARPGLTSAADLAGAGRARGRWSPYAVQLGGGDPGDLPEVRQGLAGVQDEGSQLVCLALVNADVAGADRRWLDLCAGPGGKAAMLTGLARLRHAVLVAAERRPRRAELVAQALRGYGGGPVIAADGTAPAWPRASFDRVLVDAPCTGLGALRRRPEARWRRRAADVAGLVKLQRRLVEVAVDSVRPGGIVAYVTCSPHPDETRGVVDAVLAGRRDVAEEDARGLLPDVPDLGTGPRVQLWPHRHGTDAMFLAVLRRTTGGSARALS